MVEIDVAMGVFLFVVMVGSGVLIMWMARATASGRLKRNALAGIRIPSTMASDEAWQAAHIRAKRPTMLGGWASIASGFVALLPVSAPVRATAVIAGCVLMLGFLLYGSKVGSRAALEISSRSAD